VTVAIKMFQVYDNILHYKGTTAFQLIWST